MWSRLVWLQLPFLLAATVHFLSVVFFLLKYEGVMVPNALTYLLFLGVTTGAEVKIPYVELMQGQVRGALTP